MGKVWLYACLRGDRRGFFPVALAGGNLSCHLNSWSACMLLLICHLRATRSKDGCVDGACGVNVRVIMWGGELVGLGCADGVGYDGAVIVGTNLLQLVKMDAPVVVGYLQRVQ